MLARNSAFTHTIRYALVLLSTVTTITASGCMRGSQNASDAKTQSIPVKACASTPSPGYYAGQDTGSTHIPMIGEMTARNFMDHLAAGDLRRACLLMDDTVNFDGTVVRGHDRVSARLSEIMKRTGGNVQWRYIRIIPGSEALQKFGPLPRRLAGIDLRNAIVALGRRPSGGLAVIFVDKGDDRWRVTAMTD